MKPTAPSSLPRRSRSEPTGAKFSPAAASFIAAAVADGVSIQHRFKAAPTYALTGQGYLAPSGVTEIAAAKRASKTSPSEQ